MKDGELIQAKRQGQTHVFGWLYQGHREAVYRHVCALSGRSMNGEDLLQEAILGMIRIFNSIDPIRFTLSLKVGSKSAYRSAESFFQSCKNIRRSRVQFR